MFHASHRAGWSLHLSAGSTAPRGRSCPSRTDPASARKHIYRASITSCLPADMVWGVLRADLEAYGTMPSTDLLPESALPLADLPALHDLGPLMQSSDAMQGISDSSNASTGLHFPGLPGAHGGAFGASDLARFGVPTSGGMTHFGGEPQFGALSQFGNGDDAFSFGSSFIPDDLLNGHRADGAERKLSA